jgi:hypothetical protein
MQRTPQKRRRKLIKFNFIIHVTTSARRLLAIASHGTGPRRGDGRYFIPERRGGEARSHPTGGGTVSPRAPRSGMLRPAAPGGDRNVPVVIGK